MQTTMMNRLRVKVFVVEVIRKLVDTHLATVVVLPVTYVSSFEFIMRRAGVKVGLRQPLSKAAAKATNSEKVDLHAVCTQAWSVITTKAG